MSTIQLPINHSQVLDLQDNLRSSFIPSRKSMPQEYEFLIPT